MRLTAIAGLLFCAFILPAAAAPIGDARQIAEIPYRIDYQGWITIDVSVNGSPPVDFIIDSGSTITVIFENLAAGEGFAPAPRPPMRILGLVGAERLPAFQLGDFTIGGQTMENHVGVILPDWSDQQRTPQGILGLDFLKRYHVHVDSDAGVIRLYDRSEDLSDRPRGWGATAMIADDFGNGTGELYRISVRMQGRRIPCIVDLGATGTMINYSALRSLLSGIHTNPGASSATTTGTRLNDVFENTAKVRRVRVNRVSIAGAVWRKPIFVVYNAPVFEELGIDRKPYCLIGSDLMVERSFIFNFAEGQLLIGPKKKRNSDKKS